MTDQPPSYPPPPPPDGYGYPQSQPGGYGYPPPAPYGYGSTPYPYAQGMGTNSMAIASLVSSLVGLLCFGIGPILGLVFGIIALGQIRQSGQGGRGMAIAGIVISSIIIAIFIVAMVVGALIPPRDHTDRTDRGSAPSSLVISLP